MRSDEKPARARRRALLRAAASWPLLPVLDSLAAGRVQKGIYRVRGDVRVNGTPAREGMELRAGDVIVTGRPAELLFVTGNDAFLVREGARVELDGQAGQFVVAGLRILTGAVLAVFATGEAKRIRTPTATVGIRGTGVYVEIEPGRTYVCTCYGTAELEAVADPARFRETVTSRRHDEPRYVYASGELILAKAPVINHADDELTLLESLVGRTPPFGPSTRY